MVRYCRGNKSFETVYEEKRKTLPLPTTKRPVSSADLTHDELCSIDSRDLTKHLNTFGIPDRSKYKTKEDKIQAIERYGIHSVWSHQSYKELP